MADLADELRAVMGPEDGRTLIEMRRSEPNYHVVIDKATPGEGGTSVEFGNGWGTFLIGPPVSVGDTVTIWDGQDEPGFGGERHGWALNGDLVEWLTPFERIAKRVQWLATYDRKQRERIKSGAEQRHVDYEALPAPLKARIDRFAAASPDFWKTGDYELFCCTEAARIADHLRPQTEAGADPTEVVRAFRDLPYAEQGAVISDQHSGNTFGGACALARALLAGEDV